MTPPAAPRPCVCGHDAGSHSSLRFNCLATISGTHATRCGCKAFAPQSCTCGTLPPHLHRRGCFVYAPPAVSPEAAPRDPRAKPEAIAARLAEINAAHPESAPPRATTEYPPLELAARNALIAFWDWEHYDNDTVRAERRAALRELSKCVAGCREDRLRASIAGAPPRATTPLYCTGCGKGPNPDVAVIGLAHHCGGTWEPAPLAAHPATTPEPISRVAQEDALGCGVACLAMVSGRTYADVRATVNPAQVEHGLADQTVVWWLNRHGFWHRRSWMDGEWSYPVPTSGIALMLTHDAHWVVLVDGVVLDPARPVPLPSYDFRQAIEVMRAPLAGSPSLESGALLDAYGKAYLAHADDPTPVYHARLTEVRAALDRRLSTLERDAARMREAATRFLSALNSCDATKADAAVVEMRAALSPSGEPTTTPETSE